MTTLNKRWLTIGVTKDLIVSVRLTPEEAKRWAATSEEKQMECIALFKGQVSIGAGQGRALLRAHLFSS